MRNQRPAKVVKFTLNDRIPLDALSQRQMRALRKLADKLGVMVEDLAYQAIDHYVSKRETEAKIIKFPRRLRLTLRSPPPQRSSRRRFDFRCAAIRSPVVTLYGARRSVNLYREPQHRSTLSVQGARFEVLHWRVSATRTDRCQ